VKLKSFNGYCLHATGTLNEVSCKAKSDLSNRAGSDREPVDRPAEILSISAGKGSVTSERDSSVVEYADEKVFGVSPVVRNLRDARSVYLSGELEERFIPSLMGSFLSWVQEPTALAFYDKGKDEFFFRLASKRGNSLYRARVEERLTDACGFIDSGFLNELGVRGSGREMVGNVFFITLTFNPSMTLGSRRSAWESIMPRYNRFITAFRKRYGRCWVLRSIESTCEAYPHIHLLVACEKPLSVYLGTKQDRAGNKHPCWRVRCKRSIEALWSSGYIDMQAVEAGEGGVRSVRSYLMKDILKQARADFNVELSQENVTLAMNWLFRKQSFGVSGVKVRDDLTERMEHNSNRLEEKSPVLELVDPKNLVFCGVVRLDCFGEAPFFSVLPGELVRGGVRFEFLRDLLRVRSEDEL
jgi:hypothetical protein